MSDTRPKPTPGPLSWTPAKPWPQIGRPLTAGMRAVERPTDRSTVAGSPAADAPASAAPNPVPRVRFDPVSGRIRYD